MALGRAARRTLGKMPNKFAWFLPDLLEEGEHDQGERDRFEKHGAWALMNQGSTLSFEAFRVQQVRRPLACHGGDQIVCRAIGHGNSG